MFPGFMYLHTLFLTRGRLESTWTVLKAFGAPRAAWGWGVGVWGLHAAAASGARALGRSACAQRAGLFVGASGLGSGSERGARRPGGAWMRGPRAFRCCGAARPLGCLNERRRCARPPARLYGRAGRCSTARAAGAPLAGHFRFASGLRAPSYALVPCDWRARPRLPREARRRGARPPARPPARPCGRGVRPRPHGRTARRRLRTLASGLQGTSHMHWSRTLWCAATCASGHDAASPAARAVEVSATCQHGRAARRRLQACARFWGFSTWAPGTFLGIVLTRFAGTAACSSGGTRPRRPPARAVHVAAASTARAGRRSAR
jgi:hypothetical protein